MRPLFRLAAFAAAIGAFLPTFAADSALFTAKELKWTDLAEPKGARQAVLWGDASGEQALLVRWPFNTKVSNVVRDQDVHIFVHAGTFTVDAAGTYKEFGPSGVLVIPKGVKHTLGCEAAGECRFVIHHPGPVKVTPSK
jgi:quercetin dioxygenase-like cupin family protein